MEASKIEFIHEKDVLIERYRLALENIIKHMNTVGGDYAGLSTVVVIATNALKEVKST